MRIISDDSKSFIAALIFGLIGIFYYGFIRKDLTINDLIQIKVKLKTIPEFGIKDNDVSYKYVNFYGVDCDHSYDISGNSYELLDINKMRSLSIGDTLILSVNKDRTVVEWINKDIDVYGIFLNNGSVLLKPNDVLYRDNNPNDKIITSLLVLIFVYILTLLSKLFKKEG